MATVEQSRTVRVSAHVDDLISRGASEQGITVEAFLAAAVWEAYAKYRTERMRQAMAKLDGTRRMRVSVLSGLSPERLDELGGVGEE